MTDNETQIGVRVNSSLWQEFRNDVQARKGGIRGHLKSEVENALTEYINASEGGDTNERLARIESDVETLLTLLHESEEKKKDSDVGNRVEDRLGSIKEYIEEQSGGSPVVGDKLIESAIRDVAGSSEPTLRQYKELLERDGWYLPHPSDDSRVFVDEDNWVEAVQVMRQDNDITRQRYETLVTEFGIEEFKQRYAEVTDDTDDEPERGLH
jgi:hypothetical protein